MKAIKRYLIIISLIVLLTTCVNRGDSRIVGNEDYRLVVENKSNGTIYARYGIIYPDTTPDNYSPLNNKMYKAEPGYTSTLMIRCCWEELFQTRIPSDTLMIFIYDANTLLTTPWDTVRKNCMYIKRYDLSLSDLQELDWTITYP